jgi:hypothetical protein
MLNRLYMFFGGGLLVAYLAATVSGWQVGSPEQQRLPPSVRSSPGGYRSFHFWHSGFHGGK